MLERRELEGRPERSRILGFRSKKGVRSGESGETHIPFQKHGVTQGRSQGRKRSGSDMGAWSLDGV